MTLYGQPLNTICQTAFIVEDLDATIAAYCKSLKIGPWLRIDHFVPPWQRYRGSPTKPDISIANAYSGSMMVELIQQHDDAPSVYKDVVNERGFGFHHYAVGTKSFDEQCSRYKSLGYDTAFEVKMGEIMDDARIAYFDTRTNLPGMIEIIEVNDVVEAFFKAIKEISIDWDGTNPVRTFEQLYSAGGGTKGY